MIYGTGNINIRETFASGETWDYYTNGTGTLKFIVSSRGYGIQIAGYPRKITFYNKAYVFCDENLGLDCPVVSALPTAVTFTGQALSNIVTRPDGSGFQYTTEVGSSTTGIDIKTLSEIGVPNSTITYTYDHIGYNGGPAEVNAVASVNDGLHTWTYQHNAGNGDGPTFQEVETIVNDPTGHQREGIGSNFLGILENLNDELHGGWSFDSAIGSPGYIAPEGNGMAYGYGAYSNVIAAGPFAKPGTNLPNLLWTAGYPTTCTNVLICHKPLWMKDAKGNQTDFTYSPDHGGVLTETDPADVNGVRPQKRYTYVQRYAWILNSSGGYVHASAPIWLLDSTSFCRGSAATGNPTAPCTSNDEVKTSYDYGPDSGPNNLFLRGTLVAADGVSLRSCFGNDVNGRQIWKTSPRAGLASCS
jgi:hypothetical protein